MNISKQSEDCFSGSPKVPVRSSFECSFRSNFRSNCSEQISGRERRALFWWPENLQNFRTFLWRTPSELYHSVSCSLWKSAGYVYSEYPALRKLQTKRRWREFSNEKRSRWISRKLFNRELGQNLGQMSWRIDWFPLFSALFRIHFDLKFSRTTLSWLFSSPRSLPGVQGALFSHLISYDWSEPLIRFEINLCPFW